MAERRRREPTLIKCAKSGKIFLKPSTGNLISESKWMNGLARTHLGSSRWGSTGSSMPNFWISIKIFDNNSLMDLILIIKLRPGLLKSENRAFLIVLMKAVTTYVAQVLLPTQLTLFHQLWYFYSLLQRRMKHLHHLGQLEVGLCFFTAQLGWTHSTRALGFWLVNTSGWTFAHGHRFGCLEVSLGRIIALVR